MTTNNIIPFIPGNQAAQPQTTALTAKADAWRKAFEKEQAGILHDTRSVNLGTSAPATGSASTSQPSVSEQSRLLNLTEQYNRASGAPTSPSMPAHTSTNRITPNSYGTSGSRMESFAPHSPMFLQPDQKNLLQHAIRPSHGNREITSAIGLFESHYKQKWPLKNVYVAHGDDGVSVWIRDSTLTAESGEAHKLMQRIKQALQEDGRVLASLVLNGKTITG